MNTTLIAGLALVLLLGGLGFLVALLRRSPGYRPQQATQWLGAVVALLVVGMAALTLVLLTREPPPEAPADPVFVGQPIPSFDFSPLDAAAPASNLAALRGKVVLLNLWATWCAPCLEEMPELSRLQADYGERGLVVLTLSDEDPATLESFRQETGVATLMATVQHREDAMPPAVQQGFMVRPTTYVIDPTGVVRQQFVGAQSYAFFEQAILPYLAPQP